MKRSFSFPLMLVFTLALSAVVAPVYAQPVESGPEQWIVQSTLNVRSQPRMGNNRIDHLKKGDIVTVAEITQNKQWCRVNYKDYKNAWVSCKYLGEEYPDDNNAILSEQMNKKYGLDIWILQRNVSLRSSPGIGNNLIGNMKKGDRVTIAEISEDRQWCRVNYKKYENAWALCKYLDEAPIK